MLYRYKKKIIFSAPRYHIDIIVEGITDVIIESITDIIIESIADIIVCRVDETKINKFFYFFLV